MSAISLRTRLGVAAARFYLEFAGAAIVGDTDKAEFKYRQFAQAKLGLESLEVQH